jgi:hypothetical protein
VFPEEQDFRQRLAERNETFKNRYMYQLDIKKKLWNEVNRDRYGIPILDRERYNARIDKVNYVTARKVIDEVFDDRNITMAFNGEAKRLKPILSSLEREMKITVLEKEALVE